MIASALDEIGAAAASTLPAKLAAIATRYSISLAAPATVQKWFAYETDAVRTALHANGTALVSVRWAGDAETQLARPSAGVRDSTMRVIVAYIYKDTDIAAVECHAKYVPEALAFWLDTFPIASRVPGSLATITKIAPPLGKKIAIRQKKEIVRTADEVQNYIWDAEAEFDVEIRDAALGAAPVASLVVSPTSATIPAGQALQLVATAYDGPNGTGNVLPGRNVYYVIDNQTLVSVDAVGVMRALSFGTGNVLAICEGRFASCALTLLHSVASVTVTPNPVTVNVGATQALTVVLRDSDGNIVTGRPITFHSSDPTIASVDSNGNVLGILPGTVTITVTCESVTTSVPVTSADPYAAYTAFESFTGKPDSTTSLGVAVEKGGAWIALLGVGGVSGQKGYAPAGELRAALGLMPGGNGTVQMTLRSADWVNNPIGLLFRMADKDNYLSITFNSLTQAQIRYRIAGALSSFNTLAPSPALVNGQSYVFTVIASGTSIIVKQDGVQIASQTLSGAAATVSGTLAGAWMWIPNGVNQTFDNYSVQP